jgi:23S rRNA G2445 N2-methylase RlmL
VLVAERSLVPPPASSTLVLCDPMCGSGTIAVEAALMAADTAPGLIRYSAPSSGDMHSSTAVPPHSVRGEREISSGVLRDTGYVAPCPLRWLDAQQERVCPTWQAAWRAALARDRRRQDRSLRLVCGVDTELTGNNQENPTRPWGSVLPLVLANDIHGGSIALAKAAAARAGVQDLIRFSCEDVENYEPIAGVAVSPASMVVTNPPWDIRLEGAVLAWTKLGKALHRWKKNVVSGIPIVWTLTATRDLQKHLSPLKPDKLVHVKAASVDLLFSRSLLYSKL